MNKAIRFSGPASMKRRLLHEEVAEHLRRMITEETLPEGSRVDEIELCNLLDISRTPLREALKVLQSEGLIIIEPHRGSRVATVTTAELIELIEVLGGLERQAAEMTAARISEEDLTLLEQLQFEMEVHYNAGRPQEYFDLNQRIHQRVIDLCGNRELQQVHGRLSGKTRRGRYLTTLSHAHWDESVLEHRALLEALRARDSRLAGRILHEHVRKTGDAISNLGINPAG